MVIIPLVFIFFFFFFLSSPVLVLSHPQLSLDYYNQTCPQFGKIVQDTIIAKQVAQPTTAAATLRLFLHDCFVQGCDASILINHDHTTTTGPVERDADINHSLPGDAFDVIVRAKTALELACPGVVSCADVTAQVTRDLVKMVGGPFYRVQLGRKDGLVSKSELVEGNLPRTNMTMDQIIAIFKKKGFSVQEMVALNGAHTIGFAHCKEFSNRIFHYSKSSEYDPEMNPSLAKGLRELCKNFKEEETMAAFNDINSPGTFDNKWFRVLLKGYCVLGTDHALVKDKRTRPFVDLYANNQTAFFGDFAAAMEKMSVMEAKTAAREGEVRHRCDRYNADSEHMQGI